MSSCGEIKSIPKGCLDNGSYESSRIRIDSTGVFINNKYVGMLISFDGETLRYRSISTNKYMNGQERTIILR